MKLRIRDADGNVRDIPAFKGDKGEDGKDYVLTEVDKTEIAQQAAALVDSDLLDIIGTGVVG